MQEADELSEGKKRAERRRRVGALRERKRGECARLVYDLDVCLFSATIRPEECLLPCLTNLF